MHVRRTIDPPRKGFGRRGFLTGAGATLVYAALAPVAWPRFAGGQGLGDYPFTLDIASGDPTGDGVVLWTRLAPRPFEGGGMPSHPIAVQWRVATDDRMDHIIKHGAVLATPELGHSVHAEVSGLEPSRWYWYQFKIGNEFSPIGRTRTAPASGVIEDLRFAVVSCQHYAQGFYYAHKHLAEEDLDFAVHLGDYIYEGRSTGNIGRPHLPDVEITSIDDYRIRYAVYRSDPYLQAVHASFPWIMTWDDHETENDYAGASPRMSTTRRTTRRTSCRGGPAPIRCITSTCRSARRSCRSARRCSCSAACSSARCCRSTSSTPASIDRTARRPTAC